MYCFQYHETWWYSFKCDQLINRIFLIISRSHTSNHLTKFCYSIYSEINNSNFCIQYQFLIVGTGNRPHRFQFKYFLQCVAIRNANKGISFCHISVPRQEIGLEEPRPKTSAKIGNESVPKIILNDTINYFFKLQSACWQFQTITVSECCLMKLLPYILFLKYVYTFALEIGNPVNQHCSNCTDALSFHMIRSVWSGT